MADPTTGKAYLTVISEVLYFRSIDVTVHTPSHTPAGAAEGKKVAPPVASEAGADPANPTSGAEPEPEGKLERAFARAIAMNKTLLDAGAGNQMGGNVKFIMVTDTGLTL